MYDARLATVAVLASLICGFATLADAASIPVRAGEVVAIPVGAQPDLARQSVGITITPAGGAAGTYEPGAEIVRSVVTLFPDPVSHAAVNAARGEKDANAGVQTIVYVAVPDTIPAGMATLVVTSADGAVLESVAIEVLGGGPTPDAARPPAPSALERAEHRTISVSGPALPHAVQLVLAYDADGTRPVVVNPRPSVKNLVWADDGATIRVLITPTGGQTLTDAADYVFHVAAGRIAGLRIVTVAAYDVAGTRLADVVVTVE